MSDKSPMGMEHDGPYNPKTARSEMLKLLREGPKTKTELGQGLTDGVRGVAGKIKPPQTSSGTTHTKAQRITIYYLWGDERRAVRRFIEENETLVACSLENGSGYNHLMHGMDDGLYQLLAEEWQLMGVADAE